jgi:hypothetical protein
MTFTVADPAWKIAEKKSRAGGDLGPRVGRPVVKDEIRIIVWVRNANAIRRRVNQHWLEGVKWTERPFLIFWKRFVVWGPPAPIAAIRKEFAQWEAQPQLDKIL